ncbi:MAG: outer membrane beta-barrel protein [Ferruginibacter sp.]
MKKNLILLLSILLSTFFSSTAQTKTTTKKSSPANAITNYGLPYDKNKWQFYIATENLGYSHTRRKYDGATLGKQGDLLLSLGTNYFFMKGLALGLSLDTRFTTVKDDNSKQTSNTWIAYANLTYQTGLAKNLGFLARAGVGAGSGTSKYTSNVTSYTNKEKVNEFGYKFHIGFPIGIDRNGPSYITPLLTYQHLRDKVDNGSYTGNYFLFNLGLESYLSCKQTSCDGHSGERISNSSYNQGSSYIGITSGGVVSFGTVKSKNNNYPGDDYEQKDSRQQVAASYMYYILNNLAVGADLDLLHALSKDKNSKNKSTATMIGITPMVEFNMPVKNSSLHNLSLRGGIGFGSVRNEDTNGFSSNVDKHSFFKYRIGLAYNIPFTPKLALRWGVEYESIKYKNKATKISQTYNGPQAIVGVIKFF